MPEGPEVQLVVDNLHLFLEGRALKNVEIVGGKYKNNVPPNFEEFKRELPLYFSKVTAKGKMIIFHLKTLGGQPSRFNIYAGLGMTGNFTFAPNEREMKHAAFQFNIEGKAPFPTSFIYTDSRRFGNVYFSLQNLSDKLAPGALQDSSWEQLYSTCFEDEHQTRHSLNFARSRKDHFWNWKLFSGRNFVCGEKILSISCQQSNFS